VLWGHGAGWRRVAFDEDASISDSRRSTWLELADLSVALDRGLASAGRDRLDLVVFDAGLMASIDTMGSLRGRADYVIASEEHMPALGLDYGAFAVLTQPTVDAATIFDAIARAFAPEVADSATDGGDFTLSMFDVTQTAAIEESLARFAAAAAADVVVNPGPYLQATTSVHRYGESGEYWLGFVDLGEYLNELVGVSPDVMDARDRVLAALEAARVGQRNGTPNFDAATGLTVYFPTEPSEYDNSFEDLATAPLWTPFLSAFYDAQAAVDPQN
jgi:hypothetical protein